MLQEVQSHFGLARPLYGAGIFETEHHRQILREVPAAVMTGLSTDVRNWTLLDIENWTPGSGLLIQAR